MLFGSVLRAVRTYTRLGQAQQKLLGALLHWGIEKGPDDLVIVSLGQIEESLDEVQGQPVDALQISR